MNTTQSTKRVREKRRILRTVNKMKGHKAYLVIQDQKKLFWQLRARHSASAMWLEAFRSFLLRIPSILTHYFKVSLALIINLPICRFELTPVPISSTTASFWTQLKAPFKMLQKHHISCWKRLYTWNLQLFRQYSASRDQKHLFTQSGASPQQEEHWTRDSTKKKEIYEM